MAPHSSTFAWKIPWMEKPGRLQSMRSLESDTLSDFTFTFHFHAFGERNGNPLQCSCLENPRDGEAWWAAIYGVAQSRTRLKRLSSRSSSRLNPSSSEKDKAAKDKKEQMGGIKFKKSNKKKRAVSQPKLTIKMNAARLDINTNGTKIYSVGKFFIL